MGGEYLEQPPPSVHPAKNQEKRVIYFKVYKYSSPITQSDFNLTPTLGHMVMSFFHSEETEVRELHVVARLQRQ